MGILGLPATGEEEELMSRKFVLRSLRKRIEEILSVDAIELRRSFPL